jgi:4-amino-4-deoxychorismate lyase
VPIFYDYEIHKIEFVEYEKRNIEKLIAVNSDNISYGYKYADRTAIDKLKLENTSSSEEDILIVKKGFITDTSFSSILLSDGSDWFTPKECLLPGTQRAKLLSQKKIMERSIKVDDLYKYKRIKLINAMIEFDIAAVLSADSIIMRDANDRR